MDVNEPVVEETTEKNPYGIEPESYAELEENHPKLYKNTSSGQAPGNPFEGGGSSALVVTANLTYSDEEFRNLERIELNASYKDIADAVKTGRTVEIIGSVDTGDDGWTWIKKFYIVEIEGAEGDGYSATITNIRQNFNEWAIVYFNCFAYTDTDNLVWVEELG